MNEIQFRTPRFIGALIVFGLAAVFLALHYIDPEMFGNLVKLAAGLLSGGQQ